MKKELSQFEMENTINRKTSVVEEFLDIDESLIELEQNKDLIRMEMNIIEFPIFSRSRKIKTDQVKKYYFASDKSSFLEVVPGLNKTIPGEFEERVFIALLKIFKNKGYGQVFYCTASEILDNLNIENYNTRASFYSRIREAVSKLASTNYKFKNLFYSNEQGGTIGDVLETSILSYHRVTFKDSTKEEKNLFIDKRVKDVYKISLASYFYENIVRKGYLAFDSDELLNIKDSVTRSIYTMITKWRNNNLYLKRPAFYIARRIPLSWRPETVRKTVPRIEESLIQLKESGYITDYNLLKNGKLDKSEFEIFFSEEHNKIKREVFYDEKSDFNKMVHYEEERQNILLDVNKNEKNKNEEDFIAIMLIFGEKGAKLKTLPPVIRDALKKYEFDFIKYTAEYTTFNCKVSYVKYFKDALEKRWADEFIAKKEIYAEKKAKKEKIIIEEAVLVEEKISKGLSATWDEYTKLDSEIQDKIFKEAYEDFLIQSSSKDNKISRTIFEKSKKSFILKILERYNEEINKKVILEEKKLAKKEAKNKEDTNKEIKNREVKNILVEKKSKVIVYEVFSTVSKFMLKAITYIKTENLDIDPESFVTLFNMLKEYDDETVLINYDEATKVGQIIRK